MVGIHMCTDRRVHTGWTATGSFRFGTLTPQAVHICRRATEIRNNTGKARYLIADLFYFTDDRIFRTALNDAAFVFCNRTEGTTAVTATHDINGKTNHVVSRYFCITVNRVGDTLVRQIKYRVHFIGFQRHGRRINPNMAVAMALH